jgi:DNA-binding transcriptional regulator YiaG
LPQTHTSVALWQWPTLGFADMTHTEYRAALETLKLTQSGAANLLGVDARTSRRWATDERDIPEPAARFLRYLIATGRTAAHAMKVLGD